MNLSTTLKEPSTYAGLAGLAMVVFHINEEQAYTVATGIVDIITALFSIAAIFLPESSRKPPLPTPHKEESDSRLT